MRVMYKWAEASAPARGDDHMNSDVVQSVLHLSSACADEARTPQLRAAGQTTGVGPGIADVLGVRRAVGAPPICSRAGEGTTHWARSQ